MTQYVVIQTVNKRRLWAKAFKELHFRKPILYHQCQERAQQDPCSTLLWENDAELWNRSCRVCVKQQTSGSLHYFKARQRKKLWWEQLNKYPYLSSSATGSQFHQGLLSSRVLPLLKAVAPRCYWELLTKTTTWGDHWELCLQQWFLPHLTWLRNQRRHLKEGYFFLTKAFNSVDLGKAQEILCIF